MFVANTSLITGVTGAVVGERVVVVRHKGMESGSSRSAHRMSKCATAARNYTESRYLMAHAAATSAAVLAEGTGDMARPNARIHVYSVVAYNELLLAVFAFTSARNLAARSRNAAGARPVNHRLRQRCCDIVGTG